MMNMNMKDFINENGIEFMEDPFDEIPDEVIIYEIE